MKIVTTLAALLFSYQLSWAGCGDTEFFKTAGYYVMNLSYLEYLSSTNCDYIFKNQIYSSKEAIKVVLSYTADEKKQEVVKFFNSPQYKEAVLAGKKSIDEFLKTISKEIDLKTACGMQAAELFKQNENAEKIWSASKKRCSN